MTTTLVARLDHMGDVLLAGPAVRAAAAGSSRVVLLCSSVGRPAAELLPGVDDIVTFDAPWVLPEPPPVAPDEIHALVGRLRSERIATALVLTSFHQSPLPLALLLRLAGAERIAAISEDYPGSLLDLRLVEPGDVHEVERALGVAACAGFRLPPDDDGRLSVDLGGVGTAEGLGPLGEFVVVHVGASAPARTLAAGRFAAVVDALVEGGHQVVLTGGEAERDLVGSIAGGGLSAVVDLAGRLSLAELALVLRRAQVAVVGNTGPAHLAAAVGTSLVSIFPPTVPAERWRPWRVDHVLLGDQSIVCRGCRAKVCPRGDHACLEPVTAEAVLDAVELLLRRRLERAS